MTQKRKRSDKDQRNIGVKLPKFWRGSNKKRPLKDRLLDKVSPEPNSGCWLWTGAVVTGGYGFIVRGQRRADAIHAHRASYEVFKGHVGDKQVCHACDNRACVNPDHLFLGTHQDNMNDMKAKGRSAWQNNTRQRRLTVEQVLEIRSRRKSLTEYARAYGCDLSLISRVANKKAYRNA